jgi:hypothetical protein
MPKLKDPQSRKGASRRARQQKLPHDDEGKPQKPTRARRRQRRRSRRATAAKQQRPTATPMSDASSCSATRYCTRSNTAAADTQPTCRSYAATKRSSEAAAERHSSTQQANNYVAAEWMQTGRRPKEKWSKWFAH